VAKTDSKWGGYLWYYAPLIIWIIVIFVASSGTGSMSNTSRIIRPILEFLFPTWDEAGYLVVHGYIRKGAHLTFYGILGFLAARAFYYQARNFLHKNWLLVSLALVVIVAALDETNQSFNAARTGTVYDVLLDTIGGLAAIIIFYLFFKK
jgi:VanZ family protein